MTTGLLLVNLGTPKSAANSDVHRYLLQFLLDERVIDIPYLKRQLLVRGLIVPWRYKESAKTYRKIWTEKGSPLLMHSQNLRAKVQELLDQKGPNHFRVALAMRYQTPSIEEGLKELEGCQKIVIFPLFAQYASATTGSIQQKVMETVSSWTVIPELHFISSYADHPAFIEAWAQVLAPLDFSDSHVLFSFHGLPQRQLTAAYPDCLKEGCCAKKSADSGGSFADSVSSCSSRFYCYRRQCYLTANALMERLNLPLEQTTVCFQSRLGKEPWIEPYTSDVLHELAAKGVKKIVAICPAFTADCLETIYEIGIEYRDEFLKNGGEELTLAPCLNSHAAWVEAVPSIASLL